MNSKERIRAILASKEPDRIGLGDAFWDETLARWRAEGMPADAAPADYFGFDFDALYLDASLRLPEELLEETEEYTVRADKHGFVAKQWKDQSGALGYLEHRVATRADWDRLRHRLAVDYGDGSRIHEVSYFQPFCEHPTWEVMAARSRAMAERERFVLLHVYGPLEATWRKHGFDATLMDMAAAPEFIAEMARAHVDLVIETLRTAADHGIEPDGLFLVEDMGMTTGPQFSLRTYDQVLFEEHRRLGEFLHSRGIAFFMHSDGDVRTFIPRLIDAGVQVLQPLECKAHLEVGALKAEYGRDLVFMGNIDVRRLAGEKDVSEDEVLRQLAVAKAGGGYIYHSDHSVPPTVSLPCYRRLIELVHIHGCYGDAEDQRE